MMKPIVVAILLSLLGSSDVAAFTLQMGGEKVSTTSDSMSSRRSFLSTSVATAVVGGTAILSGQPQSANAAPEIFTTDVSFIFSNIYIICIDIVTSYYILLYLLDKSLESNMQSLRQLQAKSHKHHFLVILLLLITLVIFLMVR